MNSGVDPVDPIAQRRDPHLLVRCRKSLVLGEQLIKLGGEFSAPG